MSTEPDRELLEWAAKAAGMTLGAWYDEVTAFMYREAWPGRGCWNPLTDDGDALRLAVKLKLTISMGGASPRDPGKNNIRVWRFSVPMFTEQRAEDPYAATRRAIVRAAAEIGRAMP